MKQHRTSGSSQDRPKINKPSILLSSEENEMVFDLLGRKCLSMCTGIVQLYTTEPPSHSQWMKRYTGALCFVKDSIKRSYYCRLYCLMKYELIWEHEMYDEIQLQALQPYLLAFEGQENLVALNFAVEDEAEEFRKTLTTVISNRNRRRQGRKGRVKRDPPPRPATAAPLPQKDDNTVVLRNAPPVPQIQPQSQQPPTFGLSYSSDKKRGNKKLTKADIGMPTNFKHVTHVGWSAQKGFDLTGDDVETLKPFLAKAGVSDQQLKDRETREFIYDFIQNHNVLDTVKLEGKPGEKKERQPLPPPPVPVRNQATPRIAPPPPPPVRNPAPAVPPPLPTTTPPTRQPPTRPPPCVINNSGAAPPPPPPPPPPPSFMPEIANDTHNGDVDLRKNLNEDIIRGVVLKKSEVAVNEESTSTRSNLLSEIKQGIELKPIGNREIHTPPANRDSDVGTDALAMALRRALETRGRVMQSSDEESESSDIDGEWED